MNDLDKNEMPASLGAFARSTKKTSSELILEEALSCEDTQFKPLTHGAGAAVQSVSQSVAISVQDASDFMRDMATIETTAIGVATKKMIEEKNPLYIPIIEACQNVMMQAEQYWVKVGEDGATILSAYGSVVSGKGDGGTS
jgi:hypothetical protein